MAKAKKKMWLLIGIPVFIVYFFIAARPVKRETVFKARWITSLETNFPVYFEDGIPNDGGESVSFTIGDRYGYVKDSGIFSINKFRSGYVSMSENLWAEYETVPSSIQVNNNLDKAVFTIENPEGYPLFLDNRVFIVGSGQNSVSALGGGAEKLWTYDFPAPVTCIDASGGYLLAGTLDGAVELLDSEGRPVFTSFEPGGSRLSVILGCAISRDASRLAVISGIDKQRFLLLERFGDTYNVIYHEFLGAGFRRPVHITFADNDSRVAYEKEGGLGIYSIASRTGSSVDIEGEILTLDNSGGDRFLYVVTSQGTERKRLIAVQYPETVAVNAPFKSRGAFFTRRDGKFYIAGDSTMASFELEEK